MISPVTVSDAEDTYLMPEYGWTCFHCGETFTTPGGAKAHFGFSPSSDPGCRIKWGAERGLLLELRKAEDEIERLSFELHNEGAEGLQAMRAQAARHRSQIEDVECLGYERGVRDGRAQGRLAALDEAAEVVDRRLFPGNPKDDWTQFARDRAEAAIAARTAILALKETPDAK